MSKKETAVKKTAKVKMEQPEGVQSVKQPEELDVSDMKKAVGRFIVLWREESRQICKIEKIIDDEVVYVLMTGPNKGSRFQAKFFAKTIKVYDDDNLILATTEQ
jgi:hypothetical protein